MPSAKSTRHMENMKETFAGFFNKFNGPPFKEPSLPSLIEYRFSANAHTKSKMFLSLAIKIEMMA